MRSTSPAAQRSSMRTLRPSLHPSSRSPCGTPRREASLGSSATPLNTPIRRIRSGGCARATNGHVAAAPPSSVMNSRRFDAGSPPSRPGAAHYTTPPCEKNPAVQCGKICLVEGRRWVKLGLGATRAQCPNYPRKRPCSGHRWTSQKCQNCGHRQSRARADRSGWQASASPGSYLD